MEKRRVERLVGFTRFSDERGSLVSVESGINITFEIKRVFYIYGVGENAERANHAHKVCRQIIIPVSGFVFAKVDGDNYFLSEPNVGLLIEPGELVKLLQFSSNAVILVLASEHYDEDDYV